MTPKCPECSATLVGWYDIGRDGGCFYRAACRNHHCPTNPEASSRLSIDDAMHKIINLPLTTTPAETTKEPKT